MSAALRCRPGDLAVIVRSAAGHEGKHVTCVKFIGHVLEYEGDDYWLIDRALSGKYLNFPGMSAPAMPYFKDSWLRPIRPNEGADETLEWAAVPQPQEVAA